jgi:hypothetical protein
MRTNFYSGPCAVCDAAVGALGVFKIRRDASGRIAPRPVSSFPERWPVCAMMARSDLPAFAGRRRQAGPEGMSREPGHIQPPTAAA